MPNDQRAEGDVPRTYTIELIDEEQASRLARVLIGRHLAHGDLDWLTWEDVPHLSERSFIALWEAIQHEGTLMLRTVQRDDSWSGQDTLYLLECARAGSGPSGVDSATAARTLRPGQSSDQDVSK